MSEENREECWMFNFAIEAVDGAPVGQLAATELFEMITNWVEARNLQMGGGYRAPREDELAPGPIFDIEDDSSDYPG